MHDKDSSLLTEIGVVL